MQTTEYLDFSRDAIPQIKELLKTIADAADALTQLLPDMETKQRFEFAWGHSNPSMG